jgi:hypothetical protein
MLLRFGVAKGAARCKSTQGKRSEKARQRTNVWSAARVRAKVSPVSCLQSSAHS